MLGAPSQGMLPRAFLFSPWSPGLMTSQKHPGSHPKTPPTWETQIRHEQGHAIDSVLHSLHADSGLPMMGIPSPCV